MYRKLILIFLTLHWYVRWRTRIMYRGFTLTLVLPQVYQNYVQETHSYLLDLTLVLPQAYQNYVQGTHPYIGTAVGVLALCTGNSPLHWYIHWWTRIMYRKSSLHWYPFGVLALCIGPSIERLCHDTYTVKPKKVYTRIHLESANVISRNILTD